MIPFPNNSTSIHDVDPIPEMPFFGEFTNLSISDLFPDLGTSFTTMFYKQEPKDLGDIKEILWKDCKLSGCDDECAKHHNLDFDLLSDVPDLSWFFPEEDEDVYGHVEDMKPCAYTPGTDHSYSLPKEVPAKPAGDPDKPEILKNFPAHPTSFSYSDSSSEDEVDVVTVLENYQPPTMPIFDAPRRNTRSQRKGSKQQKQTAVSAKSLKAAIKRTKVQNIRNLRRTKHSAKTYRGRKVSNSVETTPSSSVTSSAQSSRCNSDAEDCDKRSVHNKSERKRREAQRTALQTLRQSIPALSNNPKAPKVLILNSATALTSRLQSENETLESRMLHEQQKYRKLKAKLKELELQFRRYHV